MSETFTVYGNSSELSCNFFPPLQLETDSRYALGLVGIYTYHSIPNIDIHNNKFFYKKEGDKTLRTLTIPIGSYEVRDIEKYLNDELHEVVNEKIIKIKPNHNTLRCEIYSKIITVIFKKGSFGSLLGFSNNTYTSGKLYESSLPVNIIKVTSIRVECNIISGSYYNGHPSHTLYEFGIDVAPGYSIQNTPTNIIYLPINTQTISNISLKVCDQDGDLINFKGEKIVIRLELKKL